MKEELKSHPIVEGFIDVFGDWLKHRREVREDAESRPAFVRRHRP